MMAFGQTNEEEHILKMMNTRDYLKPDEMSELLESQLQKMKIRKYFSRIEKRILEQTH